MNSVDVLKLGVDALKEELQRRRLDTRGPRTELTKRLQDALEGEASAEETDEEWDDYSEAEVKVVVKEEEEEEECEPVPVMDPRCRLEEGRPPPVSRKRALEEGPGRGAHCEKLQHKRTPPQLLDLDSGDWTYGTRKPNFTESETRVLVEEILRNRHTLFSPDSWRPPPQERQRCWGEIREAVNAVSEVSREVKELKRRWQILKKKMKDRLGGEQDGRELRLCGWEESIVGFLKDEELREWREQQTQHVALLGSLSQQVCSAVQHIADMANTFKSMAASMAAVAQSVLSLASNTEATQQQEETDDKPRQT
ncbi:UNVERIFIED_CONTAM: hypothetical protein FKN15_011424 [Acipenser sinensis]